MSESVYTYLAQLNKPRPCQKCGNTFTPTSHRQKYCLPCGKIVKRQQRKDAVKRFFETRGSSNAEYLREKSYPVKQAELVCEVCNNTFTGNYRRKTCSDDCFKEWARRQLAEMRAKGLIGKQGTGEIELMIRYAFEAAGFPVSDVVEQPNHPVVSQYPILGSDGSKRYTPDFAIPSLKIAIECDESFWHSEPGTRFEGANSEAQRRAKGNDSNKEAYLKSHGWKLFRFWESRIREDAAGCVNEVILCWLTPAPPPVIPTSVVFLCECEWCHDPFSPEGNQVKYCCEICALNASREKSRLRVERYNKSHGTTSAQRMNARYHSTLHPAICTVCGGPFQARKGVKTCKDECTLKAKSRKKQSPL